VAIREGAWDCGFCGKKLIRGSVRVCTGCGKPRGKSVRFYLPENTQVVTDSDHLKDAESGPDWNCEHCQAGNSGRNTSCSQCGAVQGESPKNPTIDYDLGSTPKNADQKKSPVFAKRSISPEYLSSSNNIQDDKKRFIAFGLGILGFIALIVALFLPRERELLVEGHTWNRSVAIEEYKTLREGDWSVPRGGRLVGSDRRIRTHVSVLDHYETKTRQVSKRVRSGTETYNCGQRDLGNGYFADITCTRDTYDTVFENETYQDPVYRQDPVYDTWYEFDIDRWVLARNPKTNGSGKNATWPSFTLAKNERESGRQGEYAVHLKDVKKNKQYVFKCPENEWVMYEESERVVGKISYAGIISDLKKP
jgi:hypothetical protein